MKSPLVVGYKGEIGSFILQSLLKILPKANNIYCTDINDSEKEVLCRIKKCDVIFLCVSIHQTHIWMNKYFKHLSDKIIIEQTSLKTYLFNQLSSEVRNKLKIISMHILFKPSQTFNHQDKRLALIKSCYLDKELTKLIKCIVDPVETFYYENILEHDKDMAIQQALLHRTLLALNSMLQNTKGTTFISGKITELANRIKMMDDNLFNIIQSNEYLKSKLKILNNELNTVTYRKNKTDGL
jgi:prephenate dehydrogenase